MKAIKIQSTRDGGSATACEVELPSPLAAGHDLLVAVEAVGMNPVDTKVRPKADEDPKVLGYDAAGIVIGLGEQVVGFQMGDAVFYAGDVTRSGSNAQEQLVDSRIAALRPKSLDAAASAALPLTALTAWESLFDRLGIDPEGASNAGRTLLIIGGAGGVGSIAIQLAKWAGLSVIATASRPESSAWCRELGADHVINHHEPLAPQLRQLGFNSVNFIANFNNTERYWETMGELIAPQGRIVLIVEGSGALNFGGDYKRKSIGVSWEFMFTRSMFGTTDIAQQGEILRRVAEMIDRGLIRATANTVLKPINAANLIQAHRQIASGATIGKIVLAGWE